MDTLWLALDLPRLPLDAHPSLSRPSDRPLAVTAAGRIAVCDDAASMAGIEPGMGLAAARAMAPQIVLAPRDVERETAALEALACWAGGFTPRVVLAPPQALLLEIGGCLRYFGGAENMLAAAIEGGLAQGFDIHAAIAPTPLGATWLAQTGSDATCFEMSSLAQALDTLPLAPLPQRAQELLRGFGARTLGEARRLPRTGLAHRIGAEAVAVLARAYGELPDPRRDFVFPERFAQGVEFPAPVDSAAALLFAARRLAAALAGWLAAHRAGIDSCVLQLGHRGRPATRLELGFAATTRDASRFECVLRERLERLTLAAPVEKLRLVAEGVDLPGCSAALFDGGRATDENFAALVERLRARLGENGVYGIAAVADHRPEAATRKVAQGKEATAAASPGPRPFWLLPVPEPIAERGGRPWRDGPLRLLSGPERIESGWWDQGEGDGDARRDYFVALTADARWAWIFRKIGTPAGWFLHGWFA